MDSKVFNDHTQSELDALLDLRSRHPDFQNFFDRNEVESSRTRDRLHGIIDIPYGPHPLQRLDIFPANRPNSPIFVFIHGGYWRSLDKNDYSFIANPFTPQTCTTCIINYRLAPAATMTSIVEDVATSIAWIQTRSSDYNGDPSRIYLAGHSAGGHLALASAIHLRREDRPVSESIRGILSASGLFDLEPIRLSFLNETLNFQPSDVSRFSPLRQTDCVFDFPLILAVGENETAEFIRQSESMAQLLKDQNNACSLQVLPRLHHFDIVYELGHENGVLSRALLSLIHDGSP